MNNIDFYFDFLSPYSYLAQLRLPALADRYGYSLTYKPIDLKAAKLAAGNTAPPTVTMPAKLRYAMADLGRWAEKYGAPLDMGGGGLPESTRANKGTFFAIEKGQAREYVDSMWFETFGSGGNCNSDEVLIKIANQLGWMASEFLDFVQSDRALQLYEKGNREAQGRGVFGAPTMMIGEEMWWGNDRLDFLEEYLENHAVR